MKNATPTAQHKTQAETILARRARAKSNDTEAPEEVELDEVDELGATDYSDMDKKALRLLCDEAGIVYKKKDTIANLIELLED